MLLKERLDGQQGMGDSPNCSVITITDRPTPANTGNTDLNVTRARRQRRQRRMERAERRSINGWTVRMW